MARDKRHAATSPDGSATPLKNEQSSSAMAAQPETHTLPRGRRFRVNMAMALIALLVLAGLSAIFVATRQQPAPLAALPLSGEFLPAGTVRHMVYTRANCRSTARPRRDCRDDRAAS